MNVGDWFTTQNGNLFKVNQIDGDNAIGDFYSVVSTARSKIQKERYPKNQIQQHFFPIDDVSRRNFFKALLK